MATGYMAQGLRIVSPSYCITVPDSHDAVSEKSRQSLSGVESDSGSFSL